MIGAWGQACAYIRIVNFGGIDSDFQFWVIELTYQLVNDWFDHGFLDNRCTRMVRLLFDLLVGCLVRLLRTGGAAV
jgi:hypothetical protein